MLFHVFMNDLAYAIKECELMGYADDIEIYLSDNNPRFVKEGLNRNLETPCPQPVLAKNAQKA